MIGATSIDSMLSVWNLRDSIALSRQVKDALAPDLIFCDPHHDIHGHDAFIEMVKAFWAKHGECTITRASDIDAHHDRARYHWLITWPDGRRFEGFDAVQLDAAGKILRVDGFFGPLTRKTQA